MKKTVCILLILFSCLMSDSDSAIYTDWAVSFGDSEKFILKPCDHALAYHYFDQALIDFVGEEEFYNEFLPQYEISVSCGATISDFIFFFSIPEETFLDLCVENRLFQFGDPVNGPGYHPEILYSENPALVEQFYSCANHPANKIEEQHAGLYHVIDERLINYAGKEVWESYCWLCQRKGDKTNIVSFLRFSGITQEEFETILESTPNLLNRYVPAAGGPGYYPDVLYSGDSKLIDDFYLHWLLPANTGR